MYTTVRDLGGYHQVTKCFQVTIIIIIIIIISCSDKLGTDFKLNLDYTTENLRASIAHRRIKMLSYVALVHAIYRALYKHK